MAGGAGDDRAVKLVIALIAALALAAAVTRLPAARRALLVVLGLLALYAALTVTGVIEAIAPARDGVF
jgi:hypothetical protein